MNKETFCYVVSTLFLYAEYEEPCLIAWWKFLLLKNRAILNKETAFSIRYLVTNATYEIPNFIRYLPVPLILFPLTSVEAEKMFSQLKIVKTKLLT